MRLALLIGVLLGVSTCTGQVNIDAAAARAVLRAVQDPTLSAAAAVQVCQLPGNQGLVRKEISYNRPATTQSCADGLLAAAHGTAPDGAFAFQFDKVKPRATALGLLLDRMEADPVHFQQWIVGRVEQFAPKGPKLPITGYLIAGGSSGGFAFDEPVFYLNLAYFDDFDVARTVMAHELYHAVQAAYAGKQESWWDRKGAENGPNAVAARQCSTTARLFGALYQEGTATYVGDPLLLRDTRTAGAQKLVTDMQDGLNNLTNSLTLLELSIAGLNAPNAVPYDKVYALGFYVPEIEYKLGYVMARAIATDEGSPAFADLLRQPGWAFTAAYVALPHYGADPQHPRLGPNTLAALKRLQAGCPEHP